MNKETEDALHMLLHCSLKDTEYETQFKQYKIVRNYIANLQQENKQLKEENERARETFNDLLCDNAIYESILTELEEWINSYIPLLDAGDIVEESSQDTLKEVLDKIQELRNMYEK